MRERFDFSSISKIILDNRKTESFTHEGYYYTLFSYAFTQQEYKIFEPEQANLNKIINGERNVPKYIISLYDTAENHSQLEQGVIEILEDIADTDYVREQLYDLLWNDPTISQNKKEKLSKLSSSISKFITECLIFGMLRNFIARTKKNEGAKRKKNFLISDYLLNYHFPSVNKVFLGRENDLIEVHRLLSDTSPLFLEGIGGIGKSELAKQYGKRYKDEYEHVLFIRYQDNLRKTIIELEFIDDTLHMSDDELFRSHYRFFKQLSADTLVILDNFDTVAEKEELFHEFISMPFQLLITTRSHIEEASCYHVCEIDDTEALLQLFQTYAPQSQYNTNLALEIIDEVYRHTLTVEMTAKTLTASDITMKELLLALRKEGIALSNPNKVKVVKDDRSKKERLHKHIQTLFMLQDLSLRSQYTLMNMALVPDSGIPKNLFHEWLQTNDCYYSRPIKINMPTDQKTLV